MLRILIYDELRHVKSPGYSSRFSADNLPSRGKLSEMRPREESKRELLIDNAVRFYGLEKFANVITIAEL